MGIVDYLTSTIDDILNGGPTTITGRFGRHEIAVSLDSKKITLYIDGESVETSRVYLWPKKDAALLRGAITERGKKHLIHVYGMSGFIKPKIKICLDNKYIAGEDF
jgi:hypothetical protein